MTRTYADYRRPTSELKTYTDWKVKGWKKIFQAWRGKKKSRGAILIPDKIDFKTKAIKRDPEGHFIILKERIHQEDIKLINIYTPNIGATKYIRNILEDFMKNIDRSTLILGDFNTHCQQWMDLPKKTSTTILWH